MVQRIYSVRDTVAEEYGPPFVAKNDEVAKRQFQHVLSSVPDVSRNDYELWCVATFDVDTGIVVSNHYSVALIETVEKAYEELRNVEAI